MVGKYVLLIYFFSLGYTHGLVSALEGFIYPPMYVGIPSIHPVIGVQRRWVSMPCNQTWCLFRRSKGMDTQPMFRVGLGSDLSRVCSGRLVLDISCGGSILFPLLAYILERVGSLGVL